MEQFFKDKLSTCVNYIKNKITNEENYQLVETKRKIYYFSKCSLELDEFRQIYKMVKVLKENILRNLMDTIKYCAKVQFINEHNEKEKILIIFTICFLHFYTNFSYENNFSFEDYFNQNLINLCTKYNVFVKDLKQFKIFCYSFYYQLIKEIKNIDYLQFKNMYLYFNPYSYEEEKLIIESNYVNENSNKNNNKTNLNNTNNFDVGVNFKNSLTYLKKYINKFYSYDENYRNLKLNLRKIVNNQIMTPLISTTERIIDAPTLNISTNSNTSNNEIDFDKISNIGSSSSVSGGWTGNIGINRGANPNAVEDIIMSENEQPFSHNNINSSNTSFSPNTKHISKRILCELIKTDTNEQEKEIANEISKKLDFLLDVILNRCENKIHFIQTFMCYIVEINSDIIKMLPEYENMNDNFFMRFIIPSKNVYNYALEVYFSLHDLYNIDIITFMDIFKRKFPLKYDEGINKCVLSFYKIINDEILKCNNKDTVLENVYTEIQRVWETEIIEKGQELKRFCAV